MAYKYIIRKIPTNDGIKYIPIIQNKELWRYLIKNDDKFMVSKKAKLTFDTPTDAYRLIAEHRMEKNLKGKDRPKCLFFKEGISMIPIIGLFYTIPKLIKIPIKYLFSSPLALGGSSVIQLISIILLLMFL